MKKTARVSVVHWARCYPTVNQCCLPCGHRCRSRQMFGGAKDSWPNFPKLARKVFVRLFPTNFLPQGSWRSFWCDLQ